METNLELDLGWGNPYFLLEILNREYKSNKLVRPNVKGMTYEEDLGNPNLVKYCLELTKKLTGNDYKYALITNGATQAINSTIRSWYKAYGKNTVITSNLGYPFYADMIEKANLTRKIVDLNTYVAKNNEITLIDSPSNPLGIQYSTSPDKKSSLGKGFTIFDGAYHNGIYNACPAIQPPHEVFVGTFSKLLGISGVRVGWMATNNKEYFDHIAHDSLYENATVSRISQSLVQDILENTDIDNFIRLGRISLDNNREILQKLKSLTGTDVQEKGMFYCFETDKKLIDLFDRSNIKYVVFNSNDSQIIRLNIGQTHDILNKAVVTIQKNDRS